MPSPQIDWPWGLKTRFSIFHKGPEELTQIDELAAYDTCYLPRLSYITGDIKSHEIAWSNAELWVVNTRFSCLCTVHSDYSFVPRWQPSFIHQLEAGDACHLNGLAMVDQQPRYVSVFGRTTDPREVAGPAAGGRLPAGYRQQRSSRFRLLYAPFSQG